LHAAEEVALRGATAAIASLSRRSEAASRGGVMKKKKTASRRDRTRIWPPHDEERADTTRRGRGRRPAFRTGGKVCRIPTVPRPDVLRKSRGRVPLLCPPRRGWRTRGLAQPDGGCWPRTSAVLVGTPCRGPPDEEC
jgi:hypothetical protein